MELSKQQLESFIYLFEQEFGYRLEVQEALDRATRLLSAIKICYAPITSGELSGTKKRQIMIKNNYEQKKNGS